MTFIRFFALVCTIINRRETIIDPIFSPLSPSTRRTCSPGLCICRIFHPLCRVFLMAEAEREGGGRGKEEEVKGRRGRKKREDIWEGVHSLIISGSLIFSTCVWGSLLSYSSFFFLYTSFIPFRIYIFCSLSLFFSAQAFYVW